MLFRKDLKVTQASVIILSIHFCFESYIICYNPKAYFVCENPFQRHLTPASTYVTVLELT